jgi:hypothetical protein
VSRDEYYDWAMNVMLPVTIHVLPALNTPACEKYQTYVPAAPKGGLGAS